MSNDAQIIERAKRAWRRIRRRGRTIFAEWMLIGEALSIGRARALAEAGCNRPYGVRYHKAMAAFLQETGFNEIGDDERHKALKCFAQREAILAWIATLPPDRQRSCNHPNYVLALFKGTRNHIVQDKRHSARSQYEPRPERPTGDMIRRAAIAMRETGSNDWYVRASAAIESLTIEDHLTLARVKGAAAKMPTAQPVQLELAMA